MKVHGTRSWVVFAAVTAIAFGAPTARADVMAISPSAFPVGSALITFTGLALGTEVNGLVFDGVQFSYSLGSGHVFVSGGPTGNNVSMPALVSEGSSAGVLTLVLSGLQSMFGFGFALNTSAPVVNATTVTLFNGLTAVGALSYNGVLDPQLAGGFAGIQSTLAFDRVQLTFNSGQQFAVDNIRFASQTTVTPEPATLALVVTGFVGVAVFRRRRQARSESE